MKIKRLLSSIRLMMIGDGYKKAEYLSKISKTDNIGQKVFWKINFIPSELELIRIHNNVVIASNVTFVTHDVFHYMLHNKYPDKIFRYELGCIEVEDNVCIGARTIIMPNVRIGHDCIIAAGSIITKDIPPDSVVAGVPARIIGKTSDFEKKRERKCKDTRKTVDRYEECWRLFEEEREDI